jgi:NADPH2:quinone reductase
MTAVRVTEHGDPDVLACHTTEIPEPNTGEIRIEVRAAGVNFADIEKRRGNYPDGPTPPYRPGIEIAGVVDATSGDVELDVGQRVAAIVPSGGYAEYAIAPTERVFTVPDSLSFSEAAALPVQYLTAHNALFEWGGLEAGERVLITAASGGVGTAAVQLATAVGASVVAVTSTDTKRDLARRLGADSAIPYDAIGSDTPPIDLALDGVGGQAFTDAIETLTPGGRLVTIGMASGHIPTVAAPRLFFENKSVIGYHLEEALTRTPDRVLDAIPSLLGGIEDGAIDIVIDDTAPLSAVSRVHERLEDRSSTGKLVLAP